MSGDAYVPFSRFTDPGPLAPVLEELPASVDELCHVAERQTIHHNLCGHFGVDVRAVRRVWPPRMPDMLRALLELEPGNLHDHRPTEQRILGGCMLEAHFLAGLLRAKGIPARIRAGYFRGIRADGQHVLRFWRSALRARGIMADVLERDPDRWRELVDALTERRNAADHHIEHWICEYHDGDAWRPLDANRAFLKAHSNLDVGFHLPRRHFEYAFEAWRKLRSGADFDPDQYVEDPQDGRSHVRSQLLWDFYSLLGHDLAGIDDERTRAFVKERAYEAAPAEELAALDVLADLLAADPPVEQLVEFYVASPLRVAGVEADRYSFVTR